MAKWDEDHGTVERQDLIVKIAALGPAPGAHLVRFRQLRDHHHEQGNPSRSGQTRRFTDCVHAAVADGTWTDLMKRVLRSTLYTATGGRGRRLRLVRTSAAWGRNHR